MYIEIYVIAFQHRGILTGLEEIGMIKRNTYFTHMILHA